MDLLYTYNKLNDTFPKRLVFHLGCDGGFFSEYNNMILVMLYCLRRQLRFTLYSQDAGFGFGRGWNDYFLPFCPEDNNPLHSFFNMRFPHKYPLFLRMMDMFRKSLRNACLTSDVFHSARTMDIREDICIPELGLSGDLRTICRRLIEMTWRYNSETAQRIRTIVTDLNLPAQYLGLHIRGGDKFIETERLDIAVYMDKAAQITDIRSAFVLTDDYRVIESLCETYLEWDFYTLCDESEKGYYNKRFRKEKASVRRHKMINLFASMDILAEAEAFVGTFSSNPGMYLGMRRTSAQTFSVDIPEWKIW